ncbi:hypothetical protein [Actinomadura viridis]|uniref:Uncharacterized protein n=1 Tax=Actinomadura viridis TaxID=58110 RepID=A0A931GH25_9ACTN|nr:hypothetical protein [Actinomadura viridis]MBG6086372.1 hypothetical protein [Actinomadura viridis]
MIAASAVGAVAAGGVTWASVSQPDVAPVAAHGEIPAAVQRAKDAVPPVSPNCLPASELAKKGKEALPKNAVPQAPQLPQQAPDLKDKLPAKPEVPAVPAQPGVKAPEAKAPDAKAGVPGAKPGAPKVELPACPPEAKTLPKNDVKAPQVPQAPAVPQVPALDCDKVAPAVPVGGTAERALLLPKGLKHASTEKATKRIGTAKFCSVTQKWVHRTGNGAWVTVERIKTPTKVTEQQLRQALRLPAATPGAPAASTAGGDVMRRLPGGATGVLFFDPAGYSTLVTGSPVIGAGLQDVAAKLAQAAEAAR